jgi:hypothetical protein
MVNDIVNGALQPVRAELQKELTLAQARRSGLEARLEAATSSSERASLRSQIAKEDEGIAKLQTGIDKIGQRTTPTVGTTTPPTPPIRPSDVAPMVISILAIVFIGFPLAIAFARIIWRRASHIPAASASQLPVDATRRFDHLEQSVDAIAIEVERISENQRYLTKLLSEPRQVVGVGAGSGEPPKPH